MNVEDLLLSKDIRYIPKGNDFEIRCLNPEHPDKNPSMRIDRVTGIFNCFSCGFKGNLFAFYGERVNELQMRRDLLKKRIQDKRAESIGIEFPANAVPYLGNWRGIDPDTYKKFEAFQHSDPDFLSRVVFPVRNISGKIAGFVGRHTSAGVPKYKVVPHKAKLPLFPVVEPIKGAVILVEGIFDVLNLHDKGLTNAVCCFGTSNINEDKLSMLKLQGVEYIDIFFDGDDAGLKGAENVKAMCEQVGLLTRDIYLKDTDPGALTETQVVKLRKKLYD